MPGIPPDIELSIVEKLGEIRGILSGIQASQLQSAVNHFELDKRVRTLEQWKAYIVGIAVAASVGAQLLINRVWPH